MDHRLHKVRLHSLGWNDVLSPQCTGIKHALKGFLDKGTISGPKKEGENIIQSNKEDKNKLHGMKQRKQIRALTSNIVFAQHRLT